MSDLFLALANTVNLADFDQFLRLLGWESVEHTNERIQVFRKIEKIGKLQIVLPRRADAADFGNRVAEAAMTLATLLRQPPESVLGQIKQIGEDVLRARLISHSAESGSIPLEMAVKVVNGLKRLLTYAAAGESAPLPFFSRPTRKAIMHAEHCRFGHTFVGSFGFTVESPLAPEMQDPLIAGAAPPPFERRVMERMYRGIQDVQRATEERNLSPIIHDYTAGLNANMCDALLEISDNATDLQVSFRMDWSPKIPANAKLSGENPEVATIGPESIEYLQSASKQLRRLEESRPVTIEGRVVLLKSDSEPWEDEPENPHTIVVSWLDSDGKAIRTRVILAPEEYLFACEAHMRGRSVSVSGTLERRGKYTRLLNASNFSQGRQLNLLEKDGEPLV